MRKLWFTLKILKGGFHESWCSPNIWLAHLLSRPAGHQDEMDLWDKANQLDNRKSPNVAGCTLDSWPCLYESWMTHYHQPLFKRSLEKIQPRKIYSGIVVLISVLFYKEGWKETAFQRCSLHCFLLFSASLITAGLAPIRTPRLRSLP